MPDAIQPSAVGGSVSTADPQLAIDSIVQADKEKGAVVHTFDTNESPQERADLTVGIEDRIKAKARNGEAKGKSRNHHRPHSEKDGHLTKNYFKII